MDIRFNPELGRKWIAPPDLPSDSDLARLRGLVRRPGILRAWLGGMAFMHSGTIEHTDTVVALVLDESTGLYDVLNEIEGKDLALRNRFAWFVAGTNEIGPYEPVGLEQQGIDLAS